MTNSGYTDSNHLRLDDDSINIYEDAAGGKKLADHRTKSVKLRELFDDVLRYVSANIDYDLKVVNVIDDAVDEGHLSIMADSKTFKYVTASIPSSYEDVNVIITDDDIKDVPISSDTQYDYNAYILAQLNWLRAWADRADDKAIYGPDPNKHDPIDNAGAYLDSWTVVSQLATPSVDAPVINKADGELILDQVESIEANLEALEETLRALYESSRVSRYHIKGVNDATTPDPGEVVIPSVLYQDANYILISELGFGPGILETDPPENFTPDVLNNYLSHDAPNHRLKIGTALGDCIYKIDHDPNNSEPAVEKKVDPTDATHHYYSIRVDFESGANGNIVDEPVDTEPVFAFKSNADIDALLTQYMLRTGLKTDGTQDQFTGNIHFNNGITMDNGQIDMGNDKIVNVKDPQQLQDAATKNYVDEALENADFDNYVLKTGDKMSGDLTFAGGSGNVNLTISTGGAITAKSIIKCIRGTGSHKAFEVKPDNVTTTAFISAEGGYTFNGVGKLNNNIDIQTESSGVRLKGALKVKKSTASIGGDNIFEVNNDKVKYYGEVNDDNDVATKKYVDENSGGDSFTPGNTVAATSSSSTQPKGFYYSNKHLFFKVS